jgi:hypothetical protein
MTVEYVITPELRVKLKEPFGTLLQGSSKETMCKMNELIVKEKPPRIISVGDIVSRNLHESGIHPQVSIIDNVSLRKQNVTKIAPAERTVHVTNPAGTITKEAEKAVKEALAENTHTHVVVQGEEDLLTLIAVLYAPENALVVYGQPHKGIVVVKSTAEKKTQAQEFLKAMKPLEKLNKKKNV